VHNVEEMGRIVGNGVWCLVSVRAQRDESLCEIHCHANSILIVMAVPRVQHPHWFICLVCLVWFSVIGANLTTFVFSPK
jgi:hypothetical protein